MQLTSKCLMLSLGEHREHLSAPARADMLLLDIHSSDSRQRPMRRDVEAASCVFAATILESVEL